MQEFLQDANDNKCFINYFGSIDAAQNALNSLVRCKNCINCSDCSGCSGCSDCRGCSGCSGLSNVHNGLKPLSFIPKIENIDQVVYEACSNPNALDMNHWHTCETTHCRAGWVVTLAGKAGKELELYHGTPLAAQLIYRESGSPISPNRFYENNEKAMADMKLRAELQKQ